MNSKLWVKFFSVSLLIGAVSTLVSGLIFQWGKFSEYFTNFDLMEVLGILFFLIGMGFLFSVISQMGFVAYIALHRLGLGVFRGIKMWNIVQVILIVITIVDFVYLRNKVEENIPLYVGSMIVMLVIAYFVSKKKAAETNPQTFVSTMFLMITITTIEWIPALRVEGTSWMLTMIVPLILCNAYQILALHKVNQKHEEMVKDKKVQVKKPRTANVVK